MSVVRAAAGAFVGLVLVVGQNPDARMRVPGVGGREGGAAGGDMATEPVAQRRNVPGRHDHTVKIQGIDREYVVYVPAKAAAAAAPVVLVLHGTGGDGPRFFTMSGWRQKADAEGLIAVFPSALTHCFYDDANRDGDMRDLRERQVATRWSAGGLGSERTPLCPASELPRMLPARRALVNHPLADDMTFMRRMLEELAAAYAIDPSRIYVTGFSNGAQMSARLAVELSDRIAAAAVHAGTLEVSGRATHPISVLVSVGAADPLFLAALRASSLPMDEQLLSMPQLRQAFTGRWLTALQLPDTPEFSETRLAGVRTTRFAYGAATAGAPPRYQLVMFEGMTHVYPNGANHPIVMANLLWEFFKGKTREGTLKGPGADAGGTGAALDGPGLTLEGSGG